MSYRYNTIDIIVGIGMCAILFGALLIIVAANGTYQPAPLQSSSSEQPTGLELGMALLQPALGQAIVDQALVERWANRAIARSASDWNQATLAYDEFQSRAGGPLGTVMHQAVEVPAEHMARVQGVMGRAIVNFTTRGVRTGLLSADPSSSTYNIAMIRATEARGQRLEQEFASTWQTVLGRNIVEAIQTYRKRDGAIQEHLGTAIVGLTQAQIGSEEVLAMQQEKLGSLILAAVRTEAFNDRPVSAAPLASIPVAATVASAGPTAWPELPVGYLIAAGIVLGIVFFVGLSLAARSREEKELARMRHDAARWSYRMAA